MFEILSAVTVQHHQISGTLWKVALASFVTHEVFYLTIRPSADEPSTLSIERFTAAYFTKEQFEAIRKVLGIYKLGGYPVDRDRLVAVRKWLDVIEKRQICPTSWTSEENHDADWLRVLKLEKERDDAFNKAQFGEIIDLIAKHKQLMGELNDTESKMTTLYRARGLAVLLAALEPAGDANAEWNYVCQFEIPDVGIQVAEDVPLRRLPDLDALDQFERNNMVKISIYRHDKRPMIKVYPK